MKRPPIQFSSPASHRVVRESLTPAGTAPMHQHAPNGPEELDPRTLEFYHHAMDVLADGKVPYLVGGAYSLAHFAGVVRHTKDFDVFVAKRDVKRALDAFEKSGYRTERTFPHWLAKAFKPTS